MRFSDDALQELREIARAVGQTTEGRSMGCRMEVVHEQKGRILVLRPDPSGPFLSLEDSNGAALYGIDSLPIAKRCKHTILEGNSFFLRTKADHGLLSLTASGPGVRFAFMDGTWLGDVRKDQFFGHLDQM